MRRLALLATLAAALACASAAEAIDLHVDQALGDDANDGLSWATAKRTINAAVTEARVDAQSDTIHIAQGRYVEAITPWTTLVSYRGGYSTGGTDRDPARFATVLDGEYRIPVLMEAMSAQGSIVIEGLVFRRASQALSTWAESLTLRDCIFEDNVATTAPLSASAVYFGGNRYGQGLIENCVFRRNTTHRLDERWGYYAAALWLDYYGALTIRNCRFEENRDWAAGLFDIQNDGPVPRINLENVRLNAASLTVAQLQASNVLAQRYMIIAPIDGPQLLRNITAGQLEIFPCCGAQEPIVIQDSIITGMRDGQQVPPLVFRTSTDAIDIQDSIVRGGWVGNRVFDLDPDFVSGPLGGFYLSHAAAGDPQTSPAVDLGSRDASAAGLDVMSTRWDGIGDSGIVDLGYHHPPATSTSIRRSTTPATLSRLATTPRLPWTDAPGTASDPALKLLFYDMPEYSGTILVTLDRPADAPRLQALP